MKNSVEVDLDIYLIRICRYLYEVVDAVKIMSGCKECPVDHTPAVVDNNQNSARNLEEYLREVESTSQTTAIRYNDCQEKSVTSGIESNNDNDVCKLISDLPQVEYIGTHSPYTSDLNNRSHSHNDSLRLRLPQNSVTREDNEDACDQAVGFLMKSQERKRSHDKIDNSIQHTHSNYSDDNPGYNLSQTEASIFTQGHKKTRTLSSTTDLSRKTTFGLASRLEGPVQCSDRFGLKFRFSLNEVINLLKPGSSTVSRTLAQTRKAAIADSEDEEINSVEQQSKVPEWQSSVDGKQPTMSGSYGSNTRYTSLQNSFERSIGQTSSSSRKQSTSKLKRESHRPSRSDGYSKLGYPARAQTSRASDLCEKYAIYDTLHFDLVCPSALGTVSEISQLF